MFKLILHLIRGPLRTRESLTLENVALRHQLQVLGRSRKRPALKDRDRMVWILLRRVWQGWRKPLVIVQAETVIRWAQTRIPGVLEAKEPAAKSGKATSQPSRA